MTHGDDSMSTQRFGVAPAPGGLCLVQDLLNTAGMAVASAPDLLGDETAAQRWVDASLRTWGEQASQPSPRISVTGADLPALRALRDHVRGWLDGEAEDLAAHPLTVGVAFRHGGVTREPRGDGADAVASLVRLEMLLSSHTGTLSRLKTCRNPACGVAFYDRSRNTARVWHDMRTCGNVINLRASRARRRDTTTR